MNFKRLALHHRAVALANPCELAEQCVDPRYFFETHPMQGIRCVVGLTVNVGQE